MASSKESDKQGLISKEDGISIVPDPNPGPETRRANELFAPAKEIHDYFLHKDVRGKEDSPEILEALFNAATIDKIDSKEYKRLIDTILVYEPLTNGITEDKLARITEGIELVKDPKRLCLLSEKRIKALPRVEEAFEDISEKYNNLQGYIKEFKDEKLPEIVMELSIYERTGWLPSQDVLFKSVKTIEECINYSNQRIVLLKKIEEFRYSVEYLRVLTDREGKAKEKESKQDKPDCEHSDCKDNIAIVVVREEVKEERKKFVCQSEHNTPYCKDCSWRCQLEHNTPHCKNCGWLTFWLKNFKKRGIYVKDNNNSDCKHVWYNNVDTV